MILALGVVVGGFSIRQPSSARSPDRERDVQSWSFRTPDEAIGAEEYFVRNGPGKRTAANAVASISDQEYQLRNGPGRKR